jgi:sugar phosphate isomerase/epimerase
VNRPIGLAALTVLELPHHEQVAIAAQAGFSHVGLRLRPVAGQPYEYPIDMPEIKARLADSGVRVLDVEVFRIGPDTRVGDFEPVMTLAAQLGAQHLLVHGADPDEARMADNFGRFCDLASMYRLGANLEPMPWVEVSNVSKARAVLRRAGRVNGALLVDAIHFFRADNRLDEIAGIARHHLHYMQLCDARAECPTETAELIRQARGDRLFPGDGGLDLRGLLRALPPDIPVSLEIPVAEKMEPLVRARRAIEAARRFLA